MSDTEKKFPDDAPRSAPDPKKFCYYPFTQMLLQPTGVISPCCWNQKIVLGESSKKSLKEIWNDEPARKLRREFLEGNPVSCQQQISHIGCHLWSRRDYQDEIVLKEVQPSGPIRLDVRLNGRCNLQCIMCDVWKQPNGVYDESDFWLKGPTEIFPYLREIDVLGGEPFVQTDTYRLLDEVSACNSKCSWAFVTNGHYKFSDRIKSRLDKIDIRWMQMSVDAIRPETYAKIRVNGELARSMESFKALRQYWLDREGQGRGYRFLISMCVQIENWREVPEFLAFAKEQGVDPVLQFAYEPAQVGLLSLPLEERRRISDFFEKLLDHYPPELVNAVHLPLRESLAPAPSPGLSL